MANEKKNKVIDTEKISEEEMRSALLRSGYLLEGRLARIAAENGWYVDVNATYVDPLTGKLRENDLQGLKAMSIGKKSPIGWLFGVLLLECVNNPQPVALFTREADIPVLSRDNVKISGLPVRILNRENEWIALAEHVGIERFHHYCREGVIATQYCSFRRKKDGQKDWFATHDEDHADDFQSLVASLECAIDEHYRAWVFRGPEDVNLQLYFPVLALQGELARVEQTPEGLQIEQADHLRFRRDARNRDNVADTVQIDVVREAAFPALLQQLDADLEEFAERLRRSRKEVVKSLTAIVSFARLQTDPTIIRRNFEDPNFMPVVEEHAGKKVDPPEPGRTEASEDAGGTPGKSA